MFNIRSTQEQESSGFRRKLSLPLMPTGKSDRPREMTAPKVRDMKSMVMMTTLRKPNQTNNSDSANVSLVLPTLPKLAYSTSNCIMAVKKRHIGAGDSLAAGSTCHGFNGSPTIAMIVCTPDNAPRKGYGVASLNAAGDAIFVLRCRRWSVRAQQ